MRIGHCYTRSDICKETGFSDKLDMFIVVDKTRSGNFIILNADGEELNTGNYSFHEIDFDEIGIKEFMNEYGLRMVKRQEEQIRNAVEKSKKEMLNSGITAEDAAEVAKACMDPIGHIRKFYRDKPMEFCKILGVEHPTQEQLDDIMKACMDPIGDIQKFCEDNPILMEGKIVGLERIKPNPLRNVEDDDKDTMDYTKWSTSIKPHVLPSGRVVMEGGISEDDLNAILEQEQLRP